MKMKWGQHITTLGNVGSGKTYFNRNGLLPLYDRIIVVDSEPDDYPDFPKVPVKKAVKLSASKYRFAVHVPTRGSREFDEETIEALSMGLLSKGRETVLLLEEATDYSDASYIPPYLRSLMRRARHRKITVIVSTQRPAMLSKDYYALSVHHFFFYLSDYDVMAVKPYAPFLAERMHQIPYESYRCLYQAPSGEIITLNPIPKYNWSGRFARK